MTRIKENTVYEVIEELELPDGEDENILIDELIHLTGIKAKALGIETDVFRRVVVYNEDRNTTIEIITNNLEWKASTIAALYKRRWDIETFFKLLKQSLNVKTFIGTRPNAVKSQIFVALIAYLLLELVRRVKAYGKTAFSNFVEKIRICLCYYLTLDYVIKRIQPYARSVGLKQAAINFDEEPCLF